MVEFDWIDTDAGLRGLLDRVDKSEWIGLDTEFHRERTYFAQLALVQISWEGGLALIDPLGVSIKPLRQVLDRDAVCIIHAAGQDLEILQHECGSVPRRLFDPQIAGLFLGMGNASLAKLAHKFVGTNLNKGSQLADWLHRPLRKEELQYAASDVAHLGELYSTLKRELSDVGRLKWAEEEMEEWRTRDRSRADPDTAWWKLRGKAKLTGPSMGVAQSLAAWRERLGRELDRPPRWLLPDVALLSLAQRRPKNESALQQIRGLERAHLSRSAEILKAIAVGNRLSQEELRLPARRSDDRNLQPAASIALAWLGQRAEEENIDSSVLGTRDDVVRLIAGEETRLNHGWRRELVGDDLLALTRGDKALVLGKDLRLELRKA